MTPCDDVETSPKKPKKSVRRAGDIVLVVDDSPDTLSLINDTLEQAGIDALVALDGSQALNIAQRLRPDMILLDAVMPGLDGFETCRRLKADPALATIPVIFMTGLTDSADIVRGLESGGVDYLTKPIKPTELIARIKVHLSNARLTSSAHQALDSTGQYLFTVDLAGQMQWATPQTYTLLDSAGALQDDAKQKLLVTLKFWLQRDPAAGNKLKLDGLKKTLAVVFVERRDAKTCLLKLVDDDGPAGEEILRKKLTLTKRESEVLFWIANGKTNREIGEILEVSPRTVNKHLEGVFSKLGVENRTAAAGIAIRTLNPDS
ncbi:response regulator transcription factor [Microbulbifer agarilyticus]|uniref:response regulator transcription factor n=1 Tax=Microbulbifer agarilyticus TaxID=260552 RepID=UPI001CD638C6|nr:response regulator transcription factor [Microbulbifer agarilyticus]MCA0899565.1 response regulator transcription factor [Microbulbifer agarilyticus]